MRCLAMTGGGLVPRNDVSTPSLRAEGAAISAVGIASPVALLAMTFITKKGGGFQPPPLGL